MRDAFLRVEGVRKAYRSQKSQSPPVLVGVDLSVARGQIACVLGPSGCGKSTLLKIVAGLEPPDAGAVLVDEREVRGPGLDRGVVFQDHALFPWLSVLDNVRFAVKSRWPDWDRARVHIHSLKYLGLVGLLSVLDARPAQLSGGMRQRVGVARALAIEPKILLLDEPFGALDPRTRAGLQDELLDLCATFKQTVLLITHDVDEAILLADTIFLMHSAPAGSVVEAIPVGLARTRRAASLHRQVGYAALRHRLLDAILGATEGREPAPMPEAAGRVVPFSADTTNKEANHDKTGSDRPHYRGETS